MYVNPDALALDGLPGADFRGFAVLRPAINEDFTRGDQMLALPAAAGHTGEFQQVTEPDVSVPQLKPAVIHGIPVHSSLQ